MRRFLFALAVILCAASCAAAAETMKFERYPVEIIFEAHNRRVADKVRSIIEREVPVLSAQLGMSSILPIEVRIEDDIAPYQRELGPSLPTWGVAFAVMSDQVIVVDVKRATRALDSLEKVIPHELSHLFITQRVPRIRFPIWFLEGLAQWQAREWSLVDSWQLMNAVWGNDAPNLWHLVDRYPVHEEHARTAYRLSYAAFTDLFGDRPEELPAFLDTVARLGNFDHGFAEFFGVDVPTFTVAFHRRLEARYHTRLLVFQTGPLFSIVAVLFLAVGLRFYIRKRRKLREMERLEGGAWVDE